MKNKPDLIPGPASTRSGLGFFFFSAVLRRSFIFNCRSACRLVKRYEVTDNKLSLVCVSLIARSRLLYPRVRLLFNLKPSNPRASSHQSLPQVKRPIRGTLPTSGPNGFICKAFFLQGDSSHSVASRSKPFISVLRTDPPSYRRDLCKSVCPLRYLTTLQGGSLQYQ